MAELPQHWRAYARVQTKLSNRARLDDRSWGLEEALDRFILGDPATDPISAVDMDRAYASRSRRERSQSRRRAILLAPFVQTGSDPEAALLAREELRIVSLEATSDEFSLLLNLADGAEYSDLAAVRAVSVVALRASAFRIRKRLHRALSTSPRAAAGSPSTGRRLGRKELRDEVPGRLLMRAGRR